MRSIPSSAGRAVAGLRLVSQDGPLEVLPVLAAHRDADGRTWLRVRVPGRPNGRTGWVPRQAMGPLRLVRTTLRVDRRTLRATLTRGDRVLWSSRVGVGAPSTPTPAGRFWVRNRLRGLAGNPIYGPYAFGTGGYSRLSDWPGGGEVGIHGTDEPSLIPGRPSHGCVRVPNAAISRLWRLLPVGTPVIIT